jgi:hypothetical protein
MKKLYKHIILFLTPFMMFIIILMLLPYDKKFAYHKITGGCSVEYAYKRIVEDTTHLDIAFIGSSKTHGGVNDLLLRFLFEEEYKVDLTNANISFCGTGRNLQYSILKLLFVHKKPKALVIEIRETEDPKGHISFGVIADINDVLQAPLIANSHYGRDFFNAIKSRYDYLLWGKSTDLSYSGAQFGFGPNYKEADSNYLFYFYQQKQEQFAKGKQPHVNSSFPMHYLHLIIELARKNNCRLYFLYLPSFGYTGHTIQDIEFYEKHGKILFPPTYFQSDPNYWSDQNHLKRNGADSLSVWLAEEMIREFNISKPD